jgi:ABC1 atypical kinase-like domain
MIWIGGYTCHAFLPTSFQASQHRITTIHRVASADRDLETRTDTSKKSTTAKTPPSSTLSKVTPVPRASPLASTKRNGVTVKSRVNEKKKSNVESEKTPSQSSTTRTTSSSKQHHEWPPSLDPDEEHDSPRLQKAKYLLGLMTVKQEEAGLTSGAVTAGATASSSKSSSASVNGSTKSPADTRVAPSSSTNSTVSITQASLPSGDTAAVVVPDNYWSNGLLDGSNVVTRYAFRRGVKIAEPLVKYDPEAAAKQLFRQPTKWFVRNVQIAGPLGWWAFGVVQDYLTSSGAVSKAKRKQRAVQLRDAISGLGPAIIKAGQALASRPDLLPSEYLEELQKLQDDVPRFSNDLAFATVEKELGVDFGDVFELEQDEPVAAASIGQVYKARLKANGDVVAIKIQRPNCEDIIALDLYILRWWSGIYNQIFALLNRDINVQSIIDDFGELIYREIDYVAEGMNRDQNPVLRHISVVRGSSFLSSCFLPFSPQLPMHSDLMSFTLRSRMCSFQRCIRISPRGRS